MTYFLPDGKEYKGKMHKMANGVMHTGATHTGASKVLTTKKPIIRGGK